MAKCDDVIYREGKCVLYLCLGSNEMEALVGRIRVRSGQPVDWHSVAGRCVLKTTGDTAAVARAFRHEAPELVEQTRFLKEG